MSTWTDTPWRVAAARTTERIAFAVRPPRPITLPMSSGATRSVSRVPRSSEDSVDRHGVGVVDELSRQELHKLPHASVGLLLGGASARRLGGSSGAGASARPASRSTVLGQRCGRPRPPGASAPGSGAARLRLPEARPRGCRGRRRPRAGGRGLGGRLRGGLLRELAGPGLSVRVRTRSGGGRTLGDELVPDADLHHEVPDLTRWAARRRGASAGRAPRRSRSTTGPRAGGTCRCSR